MGQPAEFAHDGREGGRDYCRVESGQQDDEQKADENDENSFRGDGRGRSFDFCHSNHVILFRRDSRLSFDIRKRD